MNEPPISPIEGTAYIVGPLPTGVWQSHPDHIAAYASGGWRFVAPVIGARFLVKSSGAVACYDAAGWDTGTVRGSSLVIGGSQVVGARTAAIPDVAGGATVDAEARSTIGNILAALRQHGLISS